MRLADRLLDGRRGGPLLAALLLPGGARASKKPASAKKNKGGNKETARGAYEEVGPSSRLSGAGLAAAVGASG